MTNTENKKFLNEEKYQQNNQKVKKIGKILLIIGIITLVIGIFFLLIGFLGAGNKISSGFTIINSDTINDFSSFENDKIVSGIQSTINNAQNTSKGIFGSIALFAIGGFMDFFGFTLTAIGGILLFVAHRREITAYSAQQIIPVGKEIVEEVTPTIGNATETIAKSISKGIKEGLKDNNKDN